MSEREDKACEAQAQLRVWLAAAFVYWGFRILGATKKHAWDRARAAVSRAVIDKVVEWTGIANPNHPLKPGEILVTFEGGPADREVRNVEDTDWIELHSDSQTFLYRRTDRKRGASLVLELRHGMEAEAP